MTAPYTPKVGDILTGVDARGVRGPARVTHVYDGVFDVTFEFDHWSDADGPTFSAGQNWDAYANGDVPATGMRVLFGPWQESAEPAPAVDVSTLASSAEWLRRNYPTKADQTPAPKVTTIGDIAGKVKPGTVVAVHLVVGDALTLDTPYPLRLDEVDGGCLRPHRDTPCTIISEPEPEPWKAGDEADYYGARVHIIHAEDAEAWVRWPGGNAVVLLSELERPQ